MKQHRFSGEHASQGAIIWLRRLYQRVKEKWQELTRKALPCQFPNSMDQVSLKTGDHAPNQNGERDKINVVMNFKSSVKYFPKLKECGSSC